MDYHETLFEKAILEEPRPQKKERTELQKLNDAKTSQRMKDWHAKKRLSKVNDYSLIVPLEVPPPSNVKNLINNIESKIALTTK